jgi:integrase
LFARNWEDKRSYAGNLLAATTGLRAGEVLAIKKQDIQGGIVCVNHSFSRTDGLKTPKNGHERKVPLLPEVKKVLLNISANSDSAFVFGEKLNEKFLLAGLYSELDAMGIDRRGRNICFHSWWHFYAAHITDKIEMGKAQKITGHLSSAMLALCTARNRIYYN